MIATSDFLTALECTEFVFGPYWGSLQRSPDPLVGLRGSASKGEGEGRGERERKGERKRTGGAGPPFVNSWIQPCALHHLVNQYRNGRDLPLLDHLYLEIRSISAYRCITGQ